MVSISLALSVRKSLGVMAGCAAFAAVAQAQTFELPWHTIDGGQMISTGGVFELAGVVGQPDAGNPAAPLSGGAFSFVGGFWSSPAAGCVCLADMNGDGKRNGIDIHTFVSCLVGGGGDCACADVNGGGLTVGDVPAFVQSLLTGANCP